MFLRVVDGDGRRQPRPLRVEQLVGHLEARGQARGEALLVLGGAQPEVDLQLGLDHPAAGAETAAAGKLEFKKKKMVSVFALKSAVRKIVLEIPFMVCALKNRYLGRQNHKLLGKLFFGTVS